MDLSRFLLGLAFLQLLTMPITQNLWTWDHFLQGGQDFELGFFVIVTCLCLVLLRAQHCHQTVRRLLALRRLDSLQVRFGLSRLHFASVCIMGTASAGAPFLRSGGAFLAPLQI